MLTFLRRIRKSLIDAGSAQKYLIYALGEVALVVIGIMIALQINNWNQQKINDQKVRLILKEIGSNLHSEVNEMKSNLIFSTKLDSVLTLIRQNKLTKEDYSKVRTPFSPRFVILNGMEVFVNRVAFNNLAAVIDIVPPEYNQVVNEISNHYEQEAVKVQKYSEFYRTESKNYKENLVANHPWLTQLTNPKLSEEAINFFLSDPQFKNRVWSFSGTNKSLINAIIDYQLRAIHILRLLSKYSEESILSSALAKEPWMVDSLTIKTYNGTYINENQKSDTIKVETEGTRIYIVYRKIKAELVPHNEHHFHCYTGVDKVIINQEEPNSLIIKKNVGDTIKFHKIKDSEI